MGKGKLLTAIATTAALIVCAHDGVADSDRAGRSAVAVSSMRITISPRINIRPVTTESPNGTRNVSGYSVSTNYEGALLVERVRVDTINSATSNQRKLSDEKPQYAYVIVPSIE